MFSKSLLILLSAFSLGSAQLSFGASASGAGTTTFFATQSTFGTQTGFATLPTLTRASLFSTIPVATYTGPVVSLLLYFADDQPLVASVVSADSAATTLSIGCPTGENDFDCGFGPGMEFTQYGTSAFDASLSDNSFTASWHCDYSGTTSALCTEHDIQPGGDALMTTTLSATDITLIPVTITAGTDKLSAASTAKPSGTSKSNGTSTGTGAQSTKTGNAAMKVGVEALGLGVAMVFLVAL